MNIWMMLADTRNSAITILEYLGLLKQQLSEKCINSINKDVPRSYTGNEQYLWTKPMLTRLLRAASLRPHGYVQGMNFILLYVLTICIESNKGESVLE